MPATRNYKSLFLRRSLWLVFPVETHTHTHDLVQFAMESSATGTATLLADSLFSITVLALFLSVDVTLGQQKLEKSTCCLNEFAFKVLCQPAVVSLGV